MSGVQTTGPKPMYTTWVPFQIKSDAKQALDDVRNADYPDAKSYGDVLINLINEHNTIKAMLAPVLKDFPHAQTLQDVLGTLLHEHSKPRPAKVVPPG